MVQKEIECLIELNKKISCFNEMLQFLYSEHIISKDTMYNISIDLPHEQPYEIYKVLKKAINDDKIQLLDFTWTILPKETISISILTYKVNKSFTYNC